MANDVAPVFGISKVNVEDMKSLAAKAKVAAQNNPRGGAPDGSDYLNFSGKNGEFTIGADKRKIDDEERWVVDVTSFEEGWVCWKASKPASVRMANIYNGVAVSQPNFDELGPFNEQKGEGWYQAKAFVLKSLDEGQQGYFRVNSVSGVSAMAELIDAFSERAAAGLPCWPVICLAAERFEAQGFKNYKPVFEEVGWLTNSQLQELADGADIDELLAEEDAGPVDEAPPAKAAAKATGPRRRRTA